MVFGPIPGRDLRQMARYRSTFVRRAGMALLLLGVIGVCNLTWDLSRRERTSLAGQARFSRMTFGIIIVIQTLATLGAIPTLIGPAIAVERERKSLDALLTTRLSNAEIVLGTVFSGLVKAWSHLAIGAAIVALMSPLWGIDPRLVVTAYASLIATSYATAGISAVAAVEARTSRRAVSLAVGMWVAWLGGPMLVIFLLPRLWSWGAAWLVPIALPLLDSSPIAVVLNMGGVVRRGGLIEIMWRMIGLDLAGGTLRILWAIARLRRACRSAYDTETLALIRRLTHPVWRRRRRACGEAPVLWYEMHKMRQKSELSRLIGEVLGLALLVSYIVLIFWVAKPAFHELVQRGYTASGQRISSPEFHPFVRWMILGVNSSPPSGQARAELNTVVRQATGVFYFMFMLLSSCYAAESIITERERDTWSGLLATPLTGREILQGKVLGSLWRNRWYLGLMAGTWTVALVAGAVHPIGFAASLFGLAVTAWFFSVLGVYASLRCHNRESATNLAAFPPVMLGFSGLALLVLPPHGASVLMGSGSMPLVGWLCLLSYDDLQVALRTGAFPRLVGAGIQTGEGALAVLATCLIGMTAEAVGAWYLTRRALREFDASVGRPVRLGAPLEIRTAAAAESENSKLAVVA